MPQRPRFAFLRFIIEHSLLLVAGTLAGLAWANLDLEHYEHFRELTEWAVNDVGMVFFFGLAAKEVYEAMLPGGALSSPRQAAVPVLAATGGMLAPALIYLAIVFASGRPELARGWAIPCATDIAFSYMAARLIFPTGHPAIPFLLLLAIADDALGLIILAVFYPTRAVSLASFALWMAPALALCWALRRYRIQSFWPYVAVGGALSWAALFFGGLHPALALVPVVPFLPHERPEPEAAGGSAPHAALEAFHHWWHVPVEVILFFFGFVNAGVPLSSVGLPTWAVMAGLFFGKPLGIFLFTVGSVSIGFERARGLTNRAVLVLGLVAGIGFTVALFFTTAAFAAGGAHLAEAKMGALLSFVAAPVALVLGRALGFRPGVREPAFAERG
jgi:NhaA family Na+:H+ antiporter